MSEQGQSVEAGRYTSGSYPVTRCHPACGHRIGSERAVYSRCRWLSLVVGLPGLEPGTSSLSAITAPPPCNPAFLQVAEGRVPRRGVRAAAMRGQRGESMPASAALAPPPWSLG